MKKRITVLQYFTVQIHTQQSEKYLFDCLAFTIIYNHWRQLHMNFEDTESTYVGVK